jgi:ribosome-binding factor A
VFQEELEAVLRDELGDPRLDGVLVTSVELSVDYRNARVSFTTKSGGGATHEERDRVVRALTRATSYLRARLADSVDLKQVRSLRFVWDQLAANAPKPD